MGINLVDLPFLDSAFKACSPSMCRQVAGDGQLLHARLPSGVVAWVSVGYELGRSLLRDSRLSKKSRSRALAEGAHPIFCHMLTMDPPEHTRLRNALSAAFLQTRVRSLRPAIETIAHELVMQLSVHKANSFDLIEELALPLPVRVIARLLGVPLQDEPLIQEWSAALLQADLEGAQGITAIANDIDVYLRALASRKQRLPDESLMSALVHGKGRLSLRSEEISAMGFLLLNAGHETSANLIANSALSLLREPRNWQRLCTDVSLAAGMIEEVLRFESPLEFATPRYVAEDMTIDGQEIARGDLVFIGLGAANRDPNTFPEPDVFDIDRGASSRHIAFGQGVHACPGAQLARIEGEVALATLARSIPNLELAAPTESLQWTPGVVMRGLSALPVRNKA